MRRLLPLAFLVATAACWPTRQWVPVEVDWTFGGKSCAEAGVASIQIDIDNEILTPNKFTCAEAGLGADLGEFIAGSYTVTVTGFDSVDNVIFQTTQVVEVRRGARNVIPFDAAPTTGDAVVNWSFTGKSCAGAGVATVRVSIDGQVITDEAGKPDLPCSSARGDGTIIGPLAPGDHTMSLAASGSDDDYALDGLAFTIVAGQDATVVANLALATPTTASADVNWTFQPGGKTCADVGVDHIQVVFDPLADGSGGQVVATTACAGLGGAPVTGISIVDVPDGNHSFAVRGIKQNSLLYYTHHPVQTLFSAPLTTRVDVTAEPLP